MRDGGRVEGGRRLFCYHKTHSTMTADLDLPVHSISLRDIEPEQSGHVATLSF